MLQNTSVTQQPFVDNDPSADFTADWAELKAPTLELPSSARGDTGYLDGLMPDQMSASVMKGVDAQDRAFVAVRVRVRNHAGRVTREGVEVYFQRYSGGHMGVWVSGGEPGLMISNMCESDRKVLRELLANGKATIHREDYLGKNLPDLTVELY